MLILHILGLFAILLPVLILRPKAHTSKVFIKFVNDGAWPIQGLSFIMGILGAIFEFTGIFLLIVFPPRPPVINTRARC